LEKDKVHLKLLEEENRKYDRILEEKTGTDTFTR